MTGHKKNKKEYELLEGLSSVPEADNFDTEVEEEGITIEPTTWDTDNSEDYLGGDQVEAIEDNILSQVDRERPLGRPGSFNTNIAGGIPDSVKEKLAAYLKIVTDKDKANRRPWLDTINKAKPYLGFSIDQVGDSIPKNESATSENARVETIDTTFSTSVLRLWATLRSELLPSTGPVGFKIDPLTPDLRPINENEENYEVKGGIVRDALNEYLTVQDKGFYPDYDRFLLYLIVYGCVFRKIYYDPISAKPVSRFIIPEDFLVDNNCSSISESNRLTHIRHLTKREILFNMQSGVFCRVDLEYLEKNADVGDSSEGEDKTGTVQAEPTASRFPFYETHEYLDLNEFFTVSGDKEEVSIPLPYVITRCGTTNKIVSVVPNWQEEDESKTRINCFVHYNLFPGLDIYGLGLAQVLGTNSESLTTLQRMAIDAAIFQNCPAFIKAKGLKTTNNDISIKPGQVVTVTTSNLPLRDAIMPIPANGPSPSILEYMNRVTAQTQELASTTEAGLAESNQNTPVGTTIALLEVSHRVQSAIMRTVHSSFSEELQLFYRMFNPSTLRLEENRVSIIPVSDPSVESSTQRIIKAESLLKIASGNPELHNMREVYLKVYQGLGIKDIDKILLPEVPPEQTEEQQQPIDPALQVQIADIEQRRLEVESKERLAHLNIEADGYKTQMNVEFEKAKMEQDKYLAELKVKEQEEITNIRYQIELMKLELSEKDKMLNLLVREQEARNKTEIELLKLEFKEKEAELKSQIEALRMQNGSLSTPKEEIIYE